MQYRFLSGLPRSGSTLLANILAQNPRFHATGTSGVMDVMFGVRNQWDSLVEFKAPPNPEAKKRVLRGILDSFYADVEKPVVFDKCRGWLSLIEMAEYALDEQVKILVPVRDVREIVASFENLWRKTNAKKQAHPDGHYFDFQTVQGRVNYWLRPDMPVGLALSRVKDALARGYADRLHFVQMDELSTKPEATMRKVYEFLGEDYFDHDFDNVAQVNQEDDAVFGFEGLHTIRPKVSPTTTNWRETLGPWAEDLKRLNV